MSEINLKITEINNVITKLQALQSKSSSMNTASPATVGGGKTVNELEDIADTYKKLNNCLEDLISNTVSFLQNIKDSFVSSDTEAANKINK